MYPQPIDENTTSHGCKWQVQWLEAAIEYPLVDRITYRPAQTLKESKTNRQSKDLQAQEKLG